MKGWDIPQEEKRGCATGGYGGVGKGMLPITRGSAAQSEGMKACCSNAVNT